MNHENRQETATAGADYLTACPDCDLLQYVTPPPPFGKTVCRRCGKVLAINTPGAHERILALTLGAAIVFLIANAFPLMGLSAAGRQVSTTIIGGSLVLWADGHQLTAALVGLCGVVAPGAYIVMIMTILIIARRGDSLPEWMGEMLHGVELAREWAMAEVMMLGILVALVKIADLATVIVGVGMFATGALIVLIALIATNFRPEEIWARTQWSAKGLTVPEGPRPVMDYGER